VSEGLTDNDDHDHGDPMGSARLESFSDGVMAVIITIMAINLHPPTHADWHGLEQRLPDLAIYALSFAAIAIYWNNHHHLLRASTAISAAVMWFNLMLLFWLSLIPVGTQWVAQAPGSHWAATAYAVIYFLCAATYLALTRAIVQANHHDRRIVRALGYDLKGVGSMIFALVVVGLAILNPYLGYLGDVVVATWWVIPDRRLVKSKA
jgi:uncharacterized membrane protein